MNAKKTERKINIITILAVVGCFVLQLAGAYFALNWVHETIKEVPAEMWEKVFSSIGVIAGMVIAVLCEVCFLKRRWTQKRNEKK